MSLLLVCGLQAEAAIARGADDADLPVVIGGGDSQALRAKLSATLGAGQFDGVLSFGVAGALSSNLSTGQLVVADAVIHDGRTFDTDPPWREALARKLKAHEHTLASAGAVIDDRAAKSALHDATGAELVDMESGVAAELCHALGLPFCALRAISDDARTALPPSAVAGMGAGGEVRVPAVVKSLLRRPGDLPGLLRAGRDSAAAFQALRRARAELGGRFAFTA